MSIYEYPIYLNSEDEFGQYQPPVAPPPVSTPMPIKTQASVLPYLALLGVGLFVGYLISKSNHKDRIHGGVGDLSEPEDFDAEDLSEGQEVEYEHTDDPEIAEEIAMDHLTEDPEYYKKLRTIEKPSYKNRQQSDKAKTQELISDPFAAFRKNPSFNMSNEEHDELEEDSDDYERGCDIADHDEECECDEENSEFDFSHRRV